MIIKFGKSFDSAKLNRTIEWRRDISGRQKKLATELLKSTDKIYHCPLCLSDKSQFFVKVFDYPYFECCSCNHVYLTTPASQNEIKKLYSGEPSSGSSQSKIYLDHSINNHRLKYIATPKVAFIDEVIALKSIESGHLWIDIGSGNGEILIAAKSFGYSTLGIESDVSEVEYSKLQGLEVLNIFLNKDNVAESLGGAKILTLFNVLEHIRDPLQFFKMISSSIESGYIAFEVPRHPSLSSLNAQMFSDIGLRHIYPPDHLHIFSENSIDIMLKESNCECIGKWYFGQDYSDLLQNSASTAQCLDMNLFHKVLNIKDEIQEVIDRNKLCDSIIVVAKKDFYE